MQAARSAAISSRDPRTLETSYAIVNRGWRCHPNNRSSFAEASPQAEGGVGLGPAATVEPAGPGLDEVVGKAGSASTPD